MLWCKTDKVVVVAVTIIVAGSCVFAAAIYQWALDGILTNPLIPRLVAAGLSAVVVGIQLGFAGFLFGVFDIEISRRTPR
jgi:hypothetical protein